jgi:hypothetical protein
MDEPTCTLACEKAMLAVGGGGSFTIIETSLAGVELYEKFADV